MYVGSCDIIMMTNQTKGAGEKISQDDHPGNEMIPGDSFWGNMAGRKEPS